MKHSHKINPRIPKGKDKQQSTRINQRIKEIITSKQIEVYRPSEPSLFTWQTTTFGQQNYTQGLDMEINPILNNNAKRSAS
jgi:hypothetical protein